MVASREDQLRKELLQRELESRVSPENIPGLENSRIPSQQQMQQQPTQEMVDTFLGQMPKNINMMTQENVSKMIPEVLGAVVPGGFLGKAMQAGQELPVIGNVLNDIRMGIDISGPFQKLMAKIGGTGTEGALLGAAQSPENKLQGAATGFALGGAGRAIGEGAGKAINALSPSTFLRGNLPQEQLARNLEATSGTKTNLGDVIQHPLIKKMYENVLAHLPFSGAHQQMAETGTAIINRGQNIYDKFSKEVLPEQMPEKIGNALSQAAQEQRKIKNSLYDRFNNTANNIELKVGLPLFKNIANKYKEAIEDSTLLKYEPGEAALLSRLAGYAKPLHNIESEILDASGRPIKKGINYPSAQEVNILSGRLNELSNQYGKSIDSKQRRMGQIFGELGRALKSDLKKSIRQSGSKELSNEFVNAEKNYKQIYSKFLDKDVLGFTAAGKDPETLLQTFLKSSAKSDRSNQLNKLMEKLPADTQDLIRANYFSRALHGPEDARVINPNKMAKLWENLGAGQKKVLIPNKLDRRELDNFINLVSKNTDALNLMYNPKTGQRGLWSLMLQAPAGIISRPIVKRLGSEEYRNKLVNRMLQKEQKNKNSLM